MDFGLSGMIFLSVCGVLISWGIAALSLDGERDLSAKERAKKASKYFATTQVILMVVGNLLAIGISAAVTRHDTVTDAYDEMTVCDVMETMGLKSKHKYDIEVGARVGGSYGEGYFKSGLFGGSGSIQMNPASALSVGFDYQERSTILELPLRKMTFIKDATSTQPTIALRLECGESVLASQTAHLAPAHWRLESGILVLVQEVTKRDTPVPNYGDYLTDGLAPLLDDTHLKSVEVRLSPDLYDKILG